MQFPQKYYLYYAGDGQLGIKLAKNDYYYGGKSLKRVTGALKDESDYCCEYFTPMASVVCGSLTIGQTEKNI